MSDDFVPFNPSGDELNLPNSRSEFVGLGGPADSDAEVGDNSPHLLCDHQSKAGEKKPDPKVTLHRDGETIIAIEIDCPCGQRVVLNCDYGDGSSN